MRRATAHLASPSPLPLSDKVRLAGEIVADYVRARWLLRRSGLPGAVAALRAHPAAGEDGSGAADARVSGLRLGRAVGRTLGALPADSRCLVRSLVLTGLLARRGLSSTLVIGVRPDPEFAAHAWVECAGEPLLYAGEGTYGRLAEI